MDGELYDTALSVIVDWLKCSVHGVSRPKEKSMLINKQDFLVFIVSFTFQCDMHIVPKNILPVSKKLQSLTLNDCRGSPLYRA